jgi:hypothetical protein
MNELEWCLFAFFTRLVIFKSLACSATAGMEEIFPFWALIYCLAWTNGVIPMVHTCVGGFKLHSAGKMGSMLLLREPP